MSDIDTTVCPGCGGPIGQLAPVRKVKLSGAVRTGPSTPVCLGDGCTLQVKMDGSIRAR